MKILMWIAVWLSALYVFVSFIQSKPGRVYDDGHRKFYDDGSLGIYDDGSRKFYDNDR